MKRRRKSLPNPLRSLGLLLDLRQGLHRSQSQDSSLGRHRGLLQDRSHRLHRDLHTSRIGPKNRDGKGLDRVLPREKVSPVIGMTDIVLRRRARRLLILEGMKRSRAEVGWDPSFTGFLRSTSMISSKERAMSRRISGWCLGSCCSRQVCWR